MSYQVINGIEIDTLDNIEDSISSFPLKENNEQFVSVLGKRKFGDSFNQSSYDDERYGQEISSDFFKTNMGHNVYQGFYTKTPSNTPINTPIYEKKFDETEILDWCYKYLSSKNNLK